MTNPQLYAEKATLEGRVRTLIRLNTDAVLALHQAISNSEEGAIRERLYALKQRNERHTFELYTLLRHRGKNPYVITSTLPRTCLIEGLTYAKANTGMLGTLLTLAACKALTCRRYQETDTRYFTCVEQAMLASHHKDENEDLAYIVNTLKKKLGIEAR